MGIEVSWAVTAFSIVLAPLVVIVKSKMAGRLVIQKYDLIWVAWNALSWMLAPPMSVWLLGMLLMPLALLMEPEAKKRFSSRRRLLYWSCGWVLGSFAFFILVSILSKNDLVLTKQEVTSSDTFRTETVPRNGLRIHASKFRDQRWFENRLFWGWSSYSGDNLGPNFSGNEVFFGPNGFIRGDDLGEELAKWADTEPGYRKY